MNDNIEKFVSDMRKVVAFEKQHGKLEYTQQMNPGKLVLDAIENDLIKSSLDLVYICNELPELAMRFAGILIHIYLEKLNDISKVLES